MPQPTPALRPDRALTIAILAMGGEGGGVLADWIVALAEGRGHTAQTTSVPGVAQRTGATIYYVEIYPDILAPAGPPPVFALMPVPGQLDVVIASELMEAGRAVLRGLVSSDRTTFIVSSGRVFSLAEKMQMGDGRADAEKLASAARAAGKTVVFGDFAKVGAQAGSVVSAALFGALAATRALPYDVEAFRATIRASGVGVEPSLRAFDAGLTLATEPATEADSIAAGPTATPALPVFAARVAAKFGDRLPPATAALAAHGLQRMHDFQDSRYGEQYLDLLETMDRAVVASPHGKTITSEVARHLALWMSYEDTVRVAQLKTRVARFDRLGGEARPSQDGLIKVFEYFHPRIEEIADLLPPRLGRWLLRPGLVNRALTRLTDRGRTVETTSLGGFVLLWLLAGLRPVRRHMLRHAVEMQRIEDWLALVRETAMHDSDLALAVVGTQRLIKGYGDTHRRGLDNFALLMEQLPRLNERPAAAAALRTLCDAALADEHGEALRKALAKVTN